jgi:hypothetical protein
MTVIDHRRSERRLLIGALLCVLLVSTSLMQIAERSAASALGLPRQYPRIYDRHFPLPDGPQLGTRGYIPDSCLKFIALSCGRNRPEASAQAATIQALSMRSDRDDFPSATNPGFEKIDWEVGPGPESQPIPEPPGELVVAEHRRTRKHPWR